MAAWRKSSIFQCRVQLISHAAVMSEVRSAMTPPASQSNILVTAFQIPQPSEWLDQSCTLTTTFTLHLSPRKSNSPQFLNPSPLPWPLTLNSSLTWSWKRVCRERSHEYSLRQGRPAPQWRRASPRASPHAGAGRCPVVWEEPHHGSSGGIVASGFRSPTHLPVEVHSLGSTFSIHVMLLIDVIYYPFIVFFLSLYLTHLSFKI